ncbi:MAG: hypothetical protein IBX45_05405 [Campylobacterales bacterium]|nr:hypothetical protein [Campylobacterales bacterium]
MLVGFEYQDGAWIERTPRMFRHLLRAQRRALFLTQYNWCAGEEERVMAKGCHQPLVKTFFDSIHQSFPKPLSPAASCQSFCPRSAALMHAFLRQDVHATHRLACSMLAAPSVLTAKRIYRLFAKENPGMVFDASGLFLQFVYEKICKRNPDKNVYIEYDEIIIEEAGERVLSVVPCVKRVDKNNPKCVEEEISRAWKRLAQNGTRAVYLVFPRNQLFTRHIEVRQPYEQCARVKLVPYIISHSVKER